MAIEIEYRKGGRRKPTTAVVLVHLHLALGPDARPSGKAPMQAPSDMVEHFTQDIHRLDAEMLLRPNAGRAYGCGGGSLGIGLRGGLAVEENQRLAKHVSTERRAVHAKAAKVETPAAADAEIDGGTVAPHASSMRRKPESTGSVRIPPIPVIASGAMIPMALRRAMGPALTRRTSAPTVSRIKSKTNRVG